MPLSKVWAGSLVLLAAVSLPLQAASPVKVGSKIDTEGALLGNIILQVLESHGVPTVNKVQLGTTPVALVVAYADCHYSAVVAVLRHA